MSKITLASIREAADAKYAHTEIELSDGSTATLVNPLRMSKEKRAILTTKVETGEDVDQFAVMAEKLIAAAATPAEGRKLVKELDGDLAMLMATFDAYMGSVQAGEA